MNATCTSRVWRGSEYRGHYTACGKPAKGTLLNGQPACGIHLRSEQKSIEHESAQAEWRRRVRAASDDLGVQLAGSYERPGSLVSLSIEDAEALAERLNGAS